jgi:hypothetical protein
VIRIQKRIPVAVVDFLKYWKFLFVIFSKTIHPGPDEKAATCQSLDGVDGLKAQPQ